MQNAEQTSAAFGAPSLMDSEAEMSIASLTDSSRRVFQTLSGEGFVLVGYQPPDRSQNLHSQTKLISTGDHTS